MDVRPFLHPTILADIIAFKNNLYNPQNTASAERQEGKSRAISQYGYIWFKAYKRQLTTIAAIFGGLIASVTALSVMHLTQYSIAVTAVGCVGGVAGLTVWILKNRKQLSLEELKCLIPALEMPRTRALYCEAVVSTLESKALTDLDQKEILKQLNELISADDLITRQRTAYKSLLSLQDDTERHVLEQKIAQVSDEGARQTLKQSLDLINRRFANTQDLRPFIERLEAQEELVRQTLQSVLQTVARTQTPQDLAEFELEDIRAKIADVHTQIMAVEKAVEELNAI